MKQQYQTSIEENQDAADDMALKFQHLFASANGIKVLGHLKYLCRQDKSSVTVQCPDALQTMFYEGKRSIWLKIDNMLKRKVEKNE
jgi:hypothetical protein